MAKSALRIVKDAPSKEDIKYSNFLEVFASDLGYKDFNGLSAAFKVSPVNNNSVDKGSDKLWQPVTASDHFKEYTRVRENQFPSTVDKNFVVLQKKEGYEVLIHRELSSDQWNYYLLFRLADNITKRVLYAPEYETFSLFVYPDVKIATIDYPISVRGTKPEDLFKRYFKIIQHLNGKTWLSPELTRDLMKLMLWVKDHYTELQKFYKSVSKEKLEELYQQTMPDPRE